MQHDSPHALEAGAHGPHHLPVADDHHALVGRLPGVFSRVGWVAVVVVVALGVLFFMVRGVVGMLVRPTHPSNHAPETNRPPLTGAAGG